MEGVPECRMETKRIDEQLPSAGPQNKGEQAEKQ
jgi:hypothetical protein